MAILSAKNLAGPGYIILNIMRAINIITLLSIVASCAIMLIKTFVISKVHTRRPSSTNDGMY